MTITDNEPMIFDMPNNLKKGHPARTCNVMEAAELIGVHERTVRYWLRKGWIQAKRDYRGFPVFTRQDINGIRKWRTRLVKA